MCASISIQVSLFAMAHPTLLTVMGFVASALIPAEVSNSLMASGFPPFEAFGTTAQYRIRALQLIKNAQLRMQIRQALAGANGRLSNLLGHTFEELVQKSLFPATAGARYQVKVAGGRVIDVIWRNWMIELKTGKELGSRGGKQLASFAGHAADEGKDLIYLFLQKPTEAAIRAINKKGGIVAYIFE
jgi:hypothetical protein